MHVDKQHSFEVHFYEHWLLLGVANDALDGQQQLRNLRISLPRLYIEDICEEIDTSI